MGGREGDTVGDKLGDKLGDRVGDRVDGRMVHCRKFHESSRSLYLSTVALSTSFPLSLFLSIYISVLERSCGLLPRR